MNHSITSRAGFESEYPFESHFLDLEGDRYHYLDEGSGETLLFVHGNPTWSFIWRNLIKNLSSDYRCIAVDHIGCGFSDKPQNYSYTLAKHVDNLQQLVETLDLTDVTLIAHDWGGAIGMGAAVRMPERFQRFVLMNTAAFRSTRIPFRIAVCRIPLLGTLAIRGLNLFAKAAQRWAVSKPERITAAVRAGYLAPYNNWSNRIATLRFVQDIPLSPKHCSYQALTQIENGLAQFQNRPILLPWGEQDWCFTPKFLEEFLQFFPNAKPFRISDASHYIFEDAADLLLEQIHQFLIENPLGTADIPAQSNERH